MLSKRSTWDFPELKVGPKIILAPETKQRRDNMANKPHFDLQLMFY